MGQSKVRFRSILKSVLLAGFFSAAAAPVLSAAPVEAAHTKAEMAAEVESIQPGQSFWVGLQFEMEEGWHTYWKNPGDSGLATVITWQLPEGFKAGPIQWPYPERLLVEPFLSYGYDRDIILLTKINVPAGLKPGTTVMLRAQVDWLACEVDCVPGSAAFEISLPVELRPPFFDPAWHPVFDEARREIPQPAAPWQVEAFGSGQQVILKFGPPAAASGASDYYFYPEDPELIVHNAKQVLRPFRDALVLVIPRSTIKRNPVAELHGVLTFESKGERAAFQIEETVHAVPEDLQAALAPASGRVPLMLLFALIGGLILNLMPCVLPVLSIKILQFAEQARAEDRRLWRHGLSFTLGVLVTFLVLAAALIVFRQAGLQIGWGFQLQSPAFVVFLAGLFFLFGLNLWGVFEIGTSLTRLGASRNFSGGDGGSFLTGVLATVIATPCTAPFMGTALAFGLTQPAYVSLLVFAALGLGMALPYLVLSFIPQWVRFLPRGGPWMIRFKRILAVPLFATVLWLAWVLGMQRGTAAVMSLTGGLALAAAGAWFMGHPRQAEHLIRSRMHARIAFLVFLSAGLAVALYGTLRAPQTHPAMHEQGRLKWQPYDAAEAGRLVREGKPVFIDFTAAWCLTCQVNERVAISHPDVAKKFEELQVALIKADWTSRDEAIGKALAAYGRNSIPFYVLYPGGGAEPVFLSEILTPQSLLKTLKSIQPAED